MTVALSSPGAAISAILVAVNIAIILGALLVLPGGRRPQTAMAWLLLILAVPLFGFLVFLLFGRTSVGRKRRAQQEEVNAAIMARVPLNDIADAERQAALAPLVQGFARLNRELGVLPMTFDNSVELIDDYVACVEAMARDVATAEDYVHVQFYISAWDEVTAPFFEELVRAVERGVAVRFLFDHIGSKGIPVYKDMLRKLEGTGIQWAPMLPIRPLKGEVRRPDLRNHRKILVVDGRVAFSGSQNLIEACYDKPKNQKLGRAWVELMARLEGPVVQELNVVFATDWFTETGEDLREVVGAVPPPVDEPVRPGAITGVGVQVVPSGPGFTTENNLRLFTSMLYSAERRLSLTSPYFVPDDSLLYAITTAAQRGVEVELFVGATADQFMVAHAQRSYYEALLTAGVRIWLYPEPYVLHAKHFTVDDRVAVVGSSNMDMRSFALNYEVVMMMTGAEVVAGLERVQDTYRSLSTELTLDVWRARTRGQRYVDNLMRLTATLQ
ncbi:cardiolipin synthase [Nocardioides sp. Root1257]|uniref:cardiolipin synthase n=1 Tax=unclassified Nocardioides TaxID=2615069 RepID=UPI000701A258|nr:MULTISPECIES: cardiolipin synthase [unclassified Nocardioides]KQW47551.1 cardiolipin synthase [Nocardioides sp. Root1257]KRC45707.1 cardiolipin synthase [Nocardioides sp. Root224]